MHLPARRTAPSLRQATTISYHPAQPRGWFRAVMLACMFLLVDVLMTPAALADAPSGEAITPQSPGHAEVTVRYFNRDIVTLRSEFLGRSAEVRARSAEANIQRIVLQKGHAVVSAKDLPQGLLVLLSNEIVTVVTPADLDSLNNETMAQAHANVVRNLTQAVDAAERDNTPRELMRGAIWVLCATIVAAVLLGILLWIGRRATVTFQRWVESRVATMKHEPVKHLVVGMRTVGNWTLRLVLWVLGLVVFEEWLRFVLGQFGFTQPWAAAMSGWIVSELSAWGHAILGAIPGLIAATVILLLARVTAQTISLTFRSVQSGRFKLFDIDAELAEPTRKLVVAVIWLFAIAMAYPYLPGAQTDAFKGLSVLVGLMLSLGASGIVGQAAGSFTILYSRTMSVGDLIRSGEVEGTVLQIGLFATRIRTLTGVEVSIPNSVVLSGQLHNYSRSPEGPGMWLETGVTIGYDTPWRQVHRLLLDAASRTANVQSAPLPYVIQTALSDFYVEYRLRARIVDVQQRVGILSELHQHVLDTFNEAGVQIMSPNYEDDPEAPKLVSKENWEGGLPPRRTPHAESDATA